MQEVKRTFEVTVFNRADRTYGPTGDRYKLTDSEVPAKAEELSKQNDENHVYGIRLCYFPTLKRRSMKPGEVIPWY